MGLIERNSLVNKISPPIDKLLAEKLVDEFTSMERRFIQRDWEPTELDGGQFSEIVATILYHLDSGNLNHSKGHNDCLKFLENETVSHLLVDRVAIKHLCNVLRTIYKFRSQRGAVHISPTYEPNHMDSKYLVEAVRWVINEILRIFWNGDREEVAKVIRELLQFDVPCIGVFEGKILVQRTDLKPEEEILLLLHYAGETGFNRTEIGKHSLLIASTITSVLSRLIAPDKRQIIQVASGKYKLTDLGNRRIRLELADKLLVQ